MNRSDHWIGFDRRVELSWLDVAAAKVADGASTDEVREELMAFLQSLAHDPDESGSARPKTVRVILRIWGGVEESFASLQEACASLFRSAAPSDRLALHWAMTLAAYPYFFSHANIIGRLVGLQESASTQQIRRRITEKWGDRSTVHRTSRQVIRTMVAWGVLEDAGKGLYARVPAAQKVSTPVALRLAESVLHNAPGDSMPLEQLAAHPALFPFEFSLDASHIGRVSDLQVMQEGVGTVMVRQAVG